MKKITQSLQFQLTRATMLVLLAMAIGAGCLAFYRTYHETRHLQDDLLRQIATVVQPTASIDTPKSQTDARIYIQTSAQKSDEDLPDASQLADGFHTLMSDDDGYRVFVQSKSSGKVMIFQENEYREEMAEHAAWRIAIPFLVVIPLITFLLIATIRRAFRPVRQLSSELTLRRESDLTPIAHSHLPSEIQGFVLAINQLLQKTDAAMQQQQRFIADAAHELRSPMTALSLQAERLRSHDLPPDLQQQISSLQNSIRRNHALLEQLLSLARAQASEEIPRTSVAVQPILRRVIEDLLPLADAKNHDIGVISSENPSILANELDIYTLIKTLADNAIRYTPNGSQIDLSAQIQNNKLLICIEDNGNGIPQSERERVLNPFYRILGSGETGTGLGLSIADTIAKRYGGNITLKSSLHFETGLRVEVWLPFD